MLTVHSPSRGRGRCTGATKGQEGSSLLGWFGLHMGPGASEDNVKVAQAVGLLVQQRICSRGFFKAEFFEFMKGSCGAFLAEVGAPAN